MYSPIQERCEIPSFLHFEQGITASEILHDCYRAYSFKKWLHPDHVKNRQVFLFMLLLVLTTGFLMYCLIYFQAKTRDNAEIHITYNPEDGAGLVDKRAPQIWWRSVFHEYKRAWRIMTKIKEGKATWAEFFAKPQFFHDYEQFLVVMVSSPSEQHSNLCDLFESEICVLSDYLEHNRSVKLVHTNSNRFQRRKQQSRRRTALWMCTMWFIAVDIDEKRSWRQKLESNIEQFSKAIRRHTETFDLLNEGGAFEVRRISQNRLNLYLKGDILGRLGECCVDDANQNLPQTEIQDTESPNEAHKLQDQLQTNAFVSQINKFLL